jgi:spore germination cell wall hydrolase CwlJ-like protein
MTHPAQTAETTTTTTTTITTTTTTTTTQPRFNAEDIALIEHIVMNEVGHCSEESKIAVANVILNRLASPQFPDTVREVIYAPRQFSAVYGKLKPDKHTKRAVQKAINGEDNSKGAVYYYAPRYTGKIAWFEGLEFCFELEGQRFFKEAER